MTPTTARIVKNISKILILILLLGGVVYRFKFMPQVVTAIPVAKGDVASEVMGTGTLEARVRTTISPKIQGRLVEVLVDQNDLVKSGQLLARLDDAELQQQVGIAQATLDTAQSTVARVKTDEARTRIVFDQARRDYERVSAMAAARGMSQSEVEKSKEKVEVAQADMTKAAAAITEAVNQMVTAGKNLQYHQSRLSDTEIVSPFDGMVIRRNREAGDVVVPGASVLLQISTQEMWISAWVDESAMADLAIGQGARIVFRSESGNSYPGKVARIGREVDRETREFLVDVQVAHLPANWAVGQRAEVYIESAIKSGVVNIPGSMVIRQQGKAGVYLAVDGKAVWRDIGLGIHGADRVEVVQGLSSQDVIITSPQKLSEGKRIRIQ